MKKFYYNFNGEIYEKIKGFYSTFKKDLNKLANEYNKVKDDKNNEFVKQL